MEVVLSNDTRESIFSKNTQSFTLPIVSERWVGIDIEQDVGVSRYPWEWGEFVDDGWRRIRSLSFDIGISVCEYHNSRSRGTP